jgi:hypothetical protein
MYKETNTTVLMAYINIKLEGNNNPYNSNLAGAV